jgi:hypothetical protein
VIVCACARRTEKVLVRLPHDYIDNQNSSQNNNNIFFFFFLFSRCDRIALSNPRVRPPFRSCVNTFQEI